MRMETTKKRFKVDELRRMDQAGLFANERIELINGEIFLMGIGSRHAARVERARDVFNRVFQGKAAVRSQNPISIDDYNLPQPDVVVAQARDDYYESHHPRSEDIFLLLEVSDASAAHDQDVKHAVYAIAQIREYWIEDVPKDRLLVFRDPAGDHYTTSLTFQRGDMVSVLAFPELKIRVDDLLG